MAMRWHHPMFHHVNRTQCAVYCHLLDMACSSECVIWRHSVLSFLRPYYGLISKVHENKICAHLAEHPLGEKPI